eukprot:TRINITY_DN9398_c0_g1_i1.p1 TRINITY_DN9398_c0_g1~~TRINITY_DN9398_c0_g1_i1.p1  ORF type:complete len:75 (-),score=9.95 TRINITY_DN9398_c0_g1_i1:107-301(-)
MHGGKLSKLLIKSRIDVDSPNSVGHTPLLMAAFTDNIEVMNVLLSSSADITAVDRVPNVPCTGL